jgi:SAM-dependent methyltransferase
MFNFLKHPLTRNLDIDDPRTTHLRRRIIRQKPFLRRIYEDWYGWIASNIPSGGGRVLELGSGAGFLEEFISELITTDIFFCPYVNMVMDGCTMPFEDGSLKAIVMVDVFHHIPNVQAFLAEAVRCLMPGGKVLMVEPWITAWSRFVYTRLHHEPINVMAEDWSFPACGPLSGANSALPWIVFERDRRIFESKFPLLIIESILVEKPFVYILSGGVSLWILMPGFTYKFWETIESLFRQIDLKIGMFAKISLNLR